MGRFQNRLHMMKRALVNWNIGKYKISRLKKIPRLNQKDKTYNTQ